MCASAYGDRPSFRLPARTSPDKVRHPPRRLVATDATAARALRVLIVVSRPKGGGVENVVTRMANCLADAGLEVQIAIAGDTLPNFPPSRFRCIRLDSRPALYPAAAILRLQECLHEARPDIVLSYKLMSHVIVGYALRLSKVRIPWIARMTNFPDDDHVGIKKWLALSAYLKADLIWCPEPRIGDRLATLCSSIGAKTSTLPDLFDGGDLRCKADEDPAVDLPDSFILGVGRFDANKRFHKLVESFALLAANSTADLVLLGDGPLLDATRGSADAHGIANRVHFLGWVDNPYPVIKRAQLLAHCSAFDALPNTLIEAHFLGVPVVSSDAKWGPRFIVDEGRTGFLVPVDDVRAMTQRMAQILGQPELRRALSAAASTRAREVFSTQARLPEFLATIRTTAARRSRRGTGLTHGN